MEAYYLCNTRITAFIRVLPWADYAWRPPDRQISRKIWRSRPGQGCAYQFNTLLRTNLTSANNNAGAVAYSTLNFATIHAPRVACKSTTTQAFDTTTHVRAEIYRGHDMVFELAASQCTMTVLYPWQKPLSHSCSDQTILRKLWSTFRHTQTKNCVWTTCICHMQSWSTRFLRLYTTPLRARTMAAVT
jgi:hypothetical protein